VRNTFGRLLYLDDWWVQAPQLPLAWSDYVQVLAIPKHANTHAESWFLLTASLT